MRRLLNHRAPSFSLVEMLVVMVLSSIVISIIYFTYYTVTTYQASLTRRYASVDDRSRLYFLLKKDFDDGYDIRTVHENELVVSKIEGDTPVYYFFDREFVLRKQHFRQDTFRCTFTNIQFSGNEDETNTGSRKIFEANLLMEIAGDTMNLRLFKQYDRASLIETKRDTLP